MGAGEGSATVSYHRRWCDGRRLKCEAEGAFCVCALAEAVAACDAGDSADAFMHCCTVFKDFESF